LNDTDGKIENLEENPFHPQIYMDRRGLNPVLCVERPTLNHFSHGTTCQTIRIFYDMTPCRLVHSLPAFRRLAFLTVYYQILDHVARLIKPQTIDSHCSH